MHSLDRAPIVIVGAGPVGVRMARELAALSARQRLVVFGNEPWAPYDRVRLSSLLARQISQAELTRGFNLPDIGARIEYQQCEIRAIDRPSKTVIDAAGRRHVYARLILATGSRPAIPDIPGIRLTGSFTFRDLLDTKRLRAQQVRGRRSVARARHTVVLGGGLLGLEAARAMRTREGSGKTQVVQHGKRLMPHQLDAQASALLSEHMRELGIRVWLDEEVVQVLGERYVTGVRLRSGHEIACDTLIVATGIRAHTALAQRAQLDVGKGVRVDDRMCTSDPNVFAVGDCVEHHGHVFGTVAPGFEHARIAARAVMGHGARYVESASGVRLKVVDREVFSIGRVGDETQGRELTYTHAQQGIYRKLVVRRGRLVGAVALGEWDAIARVEDTLNRQSRLWPWQLARFARTGRLWAASDAAAVGDWPASATVCSCTGVKRGQLGQAMQHGADSVEALAASTGAATVCGSCRPLLQQLLGLTAAIEPVGGARALLGLSLVSLLVVMTALAAPPVPYAHSFDVMARWDVLWRSELLKQLSGYAVLGASALTLGLSVRKRWRALEIGRFDLWRVLHVTIGLLALLALAIHTGGRLGNNLNLYLMLCFCGLSLAGPVAGVVAALEHRMRPARAKRLRVQSAWLHILLFWPVPVLLGFHVLQSYYF